MAFNSTITRGIGLPTFVAGDGTEHDNFNRSAFLNSGAVLPSGLWASTETDDTMTAAGTATQIVTTTLDTSTLSNATLDGTSLIATSTGTNGGAFGFDIDSKSTGKIYFEATFTTTGDNAAFGVVQAGGWPSVNSFAGNGTNGATNFSQFSGEIDINGSNTGSHTATSASNGDVRACAVDFDNAKIWFKDLTHSGDWNNSGTADPATNTGGLAIPSGLAWVPALIAGGSGKVAAINFGASAFVGTMPSGFARWTPSGITGQSYSNFGGTGDRRNYINVWSNIHSDQTDNSRDWNIIVDGNDTTTGAPFFNSTIAVTGLSWNFDILSSVARVIDEIVIVKQASTETAVFKMQGSNDRATWDDLSLDFTLSSTATAVTIGMPNTTPYLFYRMLGISGSTSAAEPNIGEIKFRIDSSSTSADQLFDGVQAQAIFSTTTSGTIGPFTTTRDCWIILAVHAGEATTQPAVASSGVTDTHSLTWTKRSSFAPTGASSNSRLCTLELWYARATTPQAYTATVTMASAIDDLSMAVFTVAALPNMSTPWKTFTAVHYDNHTSTPAAPFTSISFSGVGLAITMQGTPHNTQPNTNFDYPSQGAHLGVKHNDGGSQWSRMAVSGTILSGPSSPAYEITYESTASDFAMLTDVLNLGDGTPEIWASFETADVFAGAGEVFPAGPMAATEFGDSWATSSGFEVLGIDAVYGLGGDGNGYSGESDITTSGPDRILVLVYTGGTVNQTDGSVEVETISSITDSAGLTWQEAAGNIIGGDLPPNYRDSAIEIWYAYAHNKLTNQSVTISYHTHPTFTTNGCVTIFSVKGMNGNFNNPFLGMHPSDFGGAYGAYGVAHSGDTEPVTSDGTNADDPLASPIATGLGDGGPVVHLIIEVESAQPGTVGPPNSPAGFTEIGRQHKLGSQQDNDQSISISLRNISIKDALHNSGTSTYVTHPTATTLWSILWDTMYQGATVPGYLQSTEAPDTFSGRGYPGAFGFVGDLTTTDTPDTMTAFGFERDSGILFSRETTDTFSAYGFQPLTMTMAVTEHADVFHAAGIGLGEDGTLITTEATDIFAASGFTPINGPFVTTEPPDRFLAIGAGVTQVRKRRDVFVT